MMLLKPAATFFSWCAYSVLQRKALETNSYATMQILSEMRDELGDPSQIPMIADKMKEPKDDFVLDDLCFLAGDKHVSRDGNIRSSKDGVVCCYSKDQSALFGVRKPPSLSMRELVAKKTIQMTIEEDLYERVNWNQKIQDCKPVIDTDADATIIEGAYTFCYRDYVNHEELMGLMWKRWGVERFLFKPSRADVLTIDSDSKCVLLAKSKMFGFIPISIEWTGSVIDDNKIVWDGTMMNMGWKRFGKVFDKPPAAEKLREENWVITLPEEEKEGDIVCFFREGKGNLVFAKEKCLSLKPGKIVRMKNKLKKLALV